MLKKLWNKLFGKGPLFEEREVDLAGNKIKMAVYNKKRIIEALEAAPAGAILFITKRTYVIVGHVEQHVEQEDIAAMSEAFNGPSECDGDCAHCLTPAEGEEDI